MAWYDVLAGVGDFLAKSVGTGYNIFTNERDFSYQKDLQQQIFNREDNSIQRRVADLEAAGMNPALAMGSGAGAGSVVGRSNTPNIDVGSALDTISAMNQIKMQREEVSAKQTENDILDTQKKLLQHQYYLQSLQAFSDLGFSIRPYVDIKTGQFGVDVGGQNNPFNGRKYADGSPLMSIERDLYLQNQFNTAAMLQFDRDFYSRHQIFKNFVQPITGAVLQGGATAAKMYGAFGPK